MSHWITKWLIVVTLLCAAFMSAAGVVDRGLQYCGLAVVTRSNETYLDNAFDKSLSGFVLLSSIKSALAVVEGSEVGVGFSLELGDVVQPVYDYVDIAWKASLAGGSIIIAMQLALKGLDYVDHWILCALLLILTLRLLVLWLLPKMTRLQRALKEAAGFATSMALAFYLLLPLSVTGAAVLSRHVTQPLLDTAYEQLQELKKEITPAHLNKEALSDLAAESLTEPSLKQRLTDTAAGIRMLITYFKTQTGKVAAVALRLIAAYLFDCILFPLFFGLIFMTMLRSGVRYLFEIRPGRRVSGEP